jgi:alpha-L-fucosidase
MNENGHHTTWLKEDRFGLFVHWGIYAVPARGEWVRHAERITDAGYDPYLEFFEPDLYDPTSWADEAAGAGMRYVVLTAKHHDGFCLWDSDLTDYKAPKSPAGRDLLGPALEAFRDAGLKVGLYYSLLDWHHPEFPIDGFHPQRDDEEFKARNSERDISKYREYLHGQVRELLTRYGRIDYLFFDFSYGSRQHPEIWGGKGREEWGSDQLMAMVRELQPGIVVNDRLDLTGDVASPEQYQPVAPIELRGTQTMWEANHTLNGSWGYDRDNDHWKSPEVIVKMLIDGVSKDGNLLLNVGPTARGEFGDRALDLLREIGAWMRRHGRAIYGCGPSLHTPPVDCRYTAKDHRLYLHVFSWPFRHLHLSGLAGKVEFARFLHDGSEIPMTQVDSAQQANTVRMGGLPPGTLTLELPVRQPDVLVPVVELLLRPAGGPG